MKSINFNFIEKVLSFKKFDIQKNLILPEVCFAGRSNVGKSSLINSLLNRKNIARTSKKPGQTKTILYYRIDNYFSLVDVPGYGYAETSKKNVTEISILLNEYFTISKNLKIVCVLIDSRHGLKKIDLEFLSFLEKNKLIYMFILTKSDKLSLSNKEKVLKTFSQFEKKRFFKIIFTSTKTKEGIKELRRDLLQIISKNENKT
ncbi:MAG: YihA family ribosome biogenesis GTP-binding protein [Pelagibacterales bacterium]|nr:YihA family ribosome biogenesis GTP-binding protein [Pelagibacterales bacterium]|tara:strand:- start:1640 stop:2248 length:609 start_codon:yes stop_codon:yes gene_type:complete